MQQCIKIYFIFIWGSTCFGRHTAHHQEPKTALAASGFAYVEGCWKCSCWTLSASYKYEINFDTPLHLVGFPLWIDPNAHMLACLLTYLFTYLLSYLLTSLFTPWSRVLLEKLTGFQLAKKFPAFYGTRKFITAVTSARHVSLSWASSIQSIPPHPNSWKSILILHEYAHLLNIYFYKVCSTCFEP